MRLGDFARAWQISDAVLAERVRSGVDCRQWPRHLQFVWTGAPLTGKRVLVRCYHGLGDTIQFIRFAGPLRTIAREVAVWVQPALLPLVASAPGVDRVLPLHDGTPDLDYDVDIEVMELPHALRAGPEMVRGAVPYLMPEGLARIPPALAHEPLARVGIVWQSGSWNSQRSIPAEIIAPLALVPGIRLFSLQRGPAQHEAASIPAIDIGTDDIDGAAGLLKHLDLLITVDSMMAHLAGALGVPVWTLLHAESDWRWMSGAESLWYPTMRLFRQTSDGDWESVVDLVCASLAARFPAPMPAGVAASAT